VKALHDCGSRKRLRYLLELTERQHSDRIGRARQAAQGVQDLLGEITTATSRYTAAGLAHEAPEREAAGCGPRDPLRDPRAELTSASTRLAGARAAFTRFHTPPKQIGRDRS